jgi:hypothetical protein
MILPYLLSSLSGIIQDIWAPVGLLAQVVFVSLVAYSCRQGAAPIITPMKSSPDICPICTFRAIKSHEGAVAGAPHITVLG